MNACRDWVFAALMKSYSENCDQDLWMIADMRDCLDRGFTVISGFYE